ncbi:hypothetical protein RB653_002757 [Dictyostelium firmibasis]|uniref:Uncharacterized protein n=1 Tax=Dictyostelium firmibasis TaxID=79012 RepID=A0AAN7TR22_9MYCE
MEINFDEAINKIDKILKTGQLFSVVGGEIFFCICSCTQSDINNISQQENNIIDEQICKRFENSFNTRFTNMVINIKTKPVRVELIGNCNSKSTELEIIKYYRINPNFINLIDNDNNNSISNENDRFIYIRLYSLPKEWSMTYINEKTFEHSHEHSHPHSHHHHDHDHNHDNGHHHHHHHHHHDHDHSHENGHSHTHNHTHSHPGSEETYQSMNFH